MSAGGLNRDACAELLSSPDSFALVLAIIAENELGMDALYGTPDTDPLDPVTIYSELESRFGAEIPTSAENRLQAAITLRTTSAFEDTVQGFVAITLALTEGQLGDMVTGGLEEPDLDECVWASFEASCIDTQMGAMSPVVAQFLRELEMNERMDPEEHDGSAEGEDFMQQMQSLVEQLTKLGLTPEQISEICARGESAISDG